MLPETPFGQAFGWRMRALGLPVALEPFEHFPRAVSNASQMAAVVSRLSDSAPVAVLVSRTLGLEKLMVAADYDARAYTAGVISSIALASGQIRGRGAPMAELFRFTFQYQLQFPGLQDLFLMNPSLTRSTPPAAPKAYGHRAHLTG